MFIEPHIGLLKEVVMKEKVNNINDFKRVKLEKIGGCLLRVVTTPGHKETRIFSGSDVSSVGTSMSVGEFSIPKPITFLYKFTGDKELAEDLKRSICHVTSFVFKITLKKLNIFCKHYKITAAGKEKDIDVLKKNLDYIFDYYNFRSGT